MALSEKQIKERKTAIGGSDVLHLVGLAPFGCTRRLWYDKKGVKEDFPFRGNRHTRRGDALEEHAVLEYMERTGRGISRGSYAVPWKLHPEFPFVGVHLDGIQEIVECGPPSALEVKCPTSRWFYACRNKPSPPNEASLQLQWAMSIWGFDEGTVLMFSGDAWMAKWWDVKADPAMQKDLIALAVLFWKGLKKADNPHPKLEVHDPRCRECPWRGTCQGLGAESGETDLDFDAADMAAELPLVNVNAEQAEEAMLQFLSAKRNLADAKAVHEIAKSKLIGMFPGPGRIETGLASAKLKTVHRGEYTAVVGATTYPLVTVKPKVEREYDDGGGDIETY